MNAEIELCGERLELRADRSLFWPRRNALLIADPHFGKSETFRAAGIPVPGSPRGILDRLSLAVEETGATRLVVLGDFWHARPGRNEPVLAELAAWRRERPALQIALVRGNHDRAGPPPKEWADGWDSGPVAEPPFVFAHVPAPSPAGYVLAGHLHPGVRLAGWGRQRVRLPCFWFGALVGVLPAFGEFTGLADVRADTGDRVFAIADGEVVDLRTTDI